LRIPKLSEERRWGKLALGLAMIKLLIFVELTCHVAEDRRQENCDQETD